MVVFKGASIVVFGLCLLPLNKAKGEEKGEEKGHGVNHQVNNFFLGDGDEPVTCGPRNARATYVRWGRSDCNSDTSDIVYSGYVGGGWYDHKGAGTNSLCLPETPEYDDGLITDTDNYRSSIYGAEFGGGAYGSFDLHDEDIVCAVCLARGRSTTLMIPAKLTCPSGWTKEYGGLLMGSYKDYNARDYICVDRNPQGRPGSSADKNGAIFHPTEGKCGSLPCPPYVDGNELACVVCSR